MPRDNNVVIGGAAGDVIDLGGGTNLAFGDSGYIEWAQQAGTNEIAQAGSIAPGDGGDDQISTAGGQNLVVGGAGDDPFTLGSGTNIVLGDSGAIVANPFHGPHFGDLPITLTSVTSVATSIGGNDYIHTGSGDEIVIGGAGTDDIHLGTGTNVVFGDNGSLDWGQTDNRPIDVPVLLHAVPSTRRLARTTRSISAPATTSSSPARATTRHRRLRHEHRPRRQRRDSRCRRQPAPFGTLPITVGLVRTIGTGIGGDDTITIGAGNAIVFGGAATTRSRPARARASSSATTATSAGRRHLNPEHSRPGTARTRIRPTSTSSPRPTSRPAATTRSRSAPALDRRRRAGEDTITGGSTTT